MRIIYVGTSEFGKPVLKKLISSDENILAVITQPDRPSGRGGKIQASPIKEVALDYGIKILQPENINHVSAIRQIKALNPDLIILVAYGQILSGEVLNIPALGCLNIHPSLLPKYKGPSPIQWTLIRGEKETGISFLFMNEKIDAGDIIMQKKIEIFPEETYRELSKRLAQESADLIGIVLQKIKEGNFAKISQPRDRFFYARKLNKKDCRINWNRSGVDIFNLIRGVTDIPGAYAEFKGKRIKITKVSLLRKTEHNQQISDKYPGDIIRVEKNGLYVLAGDQSLIIIKRLVLSGSKEMDVSQFINGYHLKKGDSFN
ncbi:MAG: methionyl-tRNA formyltransferase [Elusimicrobiota bacterium]